MSKNFNTLLKYFPEARIEEEIIFHDKERVICKTILYIGETPYSTGHAEEKRDSTFINKTSALENAATSSLGRCLSAFGLHGSEYSSADELANAIINQKDSMESKIKKTTTKTKLNTLFSDWKKESEIIEKLFNEQETSIEKTGGQNNVNKW